jgi:hypothetical protein
MGCTGVGDGVRDGTGVVVEVGLGEGVRPGLFVEIPVPQAETSKPRHINKMI